MRPADCYTLDRRSKQEVIVVNIDGADFDAGALLGGSKTSGDARAFGRCLYEDFLETTVPRGYSER